MRDELIMGQIVCRCRLHAAAASRGFASCTSTSLSERHHPDGKCPKVDEVTILPPGLSEALKKTAQVRKAPMGTDCWSEIRLCTVDGDGIAA